MGWLYSKPTRKSLIDSLIQIKTFKNLNEEITFQRMPIRHCIRGNNLWVVWRLVGYDKYNKVISTQKFITLYMMQKGYSGMWGYKDIDTAMHPYYYSCPPSYIELVDPPINQYDEDWRKACIQYHEERKSSKQKTVQLTNEI